MTVIAFTVHSALTRSEPDFSFILASGEPVFAEQGEYLAAFFAETLGADAEAAHRVLYLSGTVSEDAMIQWQLLNISLIDDTQTLFIVGQSVSDIFIEYADGFLTMEELGLPASGPIPEMAPLYGAPFGDEIGLETFEPMFALVKRPSRGRDGSLNAESAARSEKASACLRALLGV